MKLFWFFRIGSNLVAVGRTGCLGAFFLLFNLPVLLSVVGVGALAWWRMQQFPTPLVIGAGVVIAVEMIVATLVIASRAGTNRPGVFHQVDEILERSSNLEQKRYQRVYDHIHAIGEASREAYEERHRRLP